MATHGAFRRTSRLYREGAGVQVPAAVVLDSLPAICQVRLPHRLGERVAWDSVTNLLAMSCSTPACHDTQVVILDPQAPEEYSVLHIPPSSDGSTGLMQLAWSPPGTPRCLMTVTSSGSVLLWTQKRYDGTHHEMQPCTVDTWYEHKPFELPKNVVYVGWLYNPFPYGWPAKEVEKDAAMIGIEERFVTDDGLEGQLPWLRPGMLSISSLTREGELRVYWMMLGSQRWRNSNPISLTGLSPVTMADVIATETGNLRVLAVVDDTNGRCIVMEVLDDPTAFAGEAASPPSLQALTNIPMGDAQSLLQVRFNPAKAGNSFLVIIQDLLVGSESLQLVWYEQTNPDTPRGWGHRGCYQDNVEDGQKTAATGLWFSNDGSMICVASPVGTGMKLHLLTGGTLLQCALVRLPSVFTAMAYSPNGMCLALVHTTGSGQLPFITADAGSIVQLRAVDELLVALPQEGSRPQDSTMFEDHLLAANAENMAERLMWSMACETTHWDVVSCFNLLSTGFGETFRFHVVDLVDQALHAEKHGMRPHFGVVWNQIKYFVLQSSSHPLSRILCIDLMTRCVMDVLESTAQHTIFRDEQLIRAHKLAGQTGKVYDSHALDLRSCWVDWMCRFSELFLRTIKQWVTERSAAKAAGDEYSEDIDMKPFVRLLADAYFWKHLTQAAAGFWLLLKGRSEGPNSEGEALAVYTESFLKTVKGLQGSIGADQSAHLKAKGVDAQPDDPTLGLSLASGATQSFKGPLCLHYYRTGGSLRWQALQKCVAEMPSFQNLAPITNAEALVLVETVGLIRPHKVADNFLRKMLGNFADSACSLPMPVMPPGCAAPSSPSSVAKRKRWTAERDVAFGLMPPAMKWSGHHDVISCDKLAWDSPNLLQSTDCLFATTSMHGQQCSEDGHEAIVYGAWVDSCPLLGGLWRRVRHGCEYADNQGNNTK